MDQQRWNLYLYRSIAFYHTKGTRILLPHRSRCQWLHTKRYGSDWGYQKCAGSFSNLRPEFAKPGYNNVCYPEQIRFKNLSTKGESFVWNFDDGIIISKPKTDTASILRGFKQAGAYRVKLKAINTGTCNKADSVVKIINYFKNTVKAADDAQICEGYSFQLTAPGASLYDWFTADRSFTSSIPSPVVKPLTSTQYFVNATDANGCKKKDTLQITVLNKVELKWQYRLLGSCTDRPSLFVENETPPAADVTFRFDFGDGTTSEETEVQHEYKEMASTA